MYRVQLFLSLTLVGVFAIVLAATAEAGARGPKRTSVREVIVHATGGPFCQGGQVRFSPAGSHESIKRFFEASGGVSIHYIVGRGGEVVKSVPEDEVAIHTIGHNEAAIGIELINQGDGKDPFPAAQLAALTRLVADIRKRWRLPLEAVKGHADVDRTTFQCGGQTVRRKQDPGANFPWDEFRIQVRIASGDVAPRRVNRAALGLAGTR